MATCHSALSASLILHNHQGRLDDLLLEIFDSELEVPDNRHDFVWSALLAELRFVNRPSLLQKCPVVQCAPQYV